MGQALKNILFSFLIAATASAQTLMLTPETSVAPSRIGTAARATYNVLSASDGLNQLVVWTDNRAGINDYSGFATRVDSQGHVLDIPNIALPLSAIGVFWNGREYVIVGSGGKYVRMSPAGELLDVTPRTFDYNAHGDILGIAWSGDRLLIASHTNITSTNFVTNLYVSIYDAAFNLIRGDVLVSSEVVEATYQKRIATNGSSFVIGSTECHGQSSTNCTVNLDAVDRNGAVLRTGAIAQASDYREPVVASDGKGYLMLWGTRANGGHGGEYIGALIQEGFVVIYGSVGPVAAGNLDYFVTPDLAWEGDSYQFVYEDARATGPNSSYLNWSYNVAAITISATGAASNPTLLDPYDWTRPPTPTAAGRPGARFAMWTANVGNGGDSVFSGRVYNDSSSTRFEIAQGPLPQRYPVAATAGDVSLIAWRGPFSSVFARDAIYAARVDAFGRVLDPAPLLVATQTCDDTFPAVATNGSDFLVAWQELAGIRAVRVAHNGMLLDPTAIAFGGVISPQCGGAPPAIAWNGSTYLVAWGGQQLAGGMTGVNASRITPGGTLLDDPPIDVSRNPSAVALVRAASDGRDFFVAWSTNEARGARVSAGGTPLDGGGFSLVLRYSRMLFWSGKSYVLLSDGSDGAHSVRATPDGQRLDLVPGQTLPGVKIPFDPYSASAACSARGCYVYGVKDNQIVASRIDDGTAITMTSTPLAAIDGAWQQPFAFGPDLKQLGYVRVTTAGTLHLFTRSIVPVRGRAIKP